MNHYATQKSLSDAVDGGGLLVVAQWEAKPGEADKVAAILDRFLPEAQREEGVKLFLISRARDNPAQFLFYVPRRGRFQSAPGERAFQDLHRRRSPAAAGEARTGSIRTHVNTSSYAAVRSGPRHTTI